MVKAIRITETGGPEVLKLVEVDLADPGAGEVQVQHTAIGSTTSTLTFGQAYTRHPYHAAWVLKQQASSRKSATVSRP